MLNSSLSALLVLSSHLASSSSFSLLFSLYLFLLFLVLQNFEKFIHTCTHEHSSWESQKRATGCIWPSSHSWLTRSQQFSNIDQKLSKNPWCADKKCQKPETQLWFAHTYGVNIPTVPIALLLGTELGTEAAQRPDCPKSLGSNHEQTTHCRNSVTTKYGKLWCWLCN